MKSDIVTIIPSRGRPDNILDVSRCFRETNSESHLLVVVDADDASLAEYQRLDVEILVVHPMRRGMAAPLNHAAGQVKEQYSFFCFMGDDHRPRTAMWDQDLRAEIAGFPAGLSYGNDLLQRQNLPTAVMMTGSIVRAMNGMVPHTMSHLYLDDFWKRLGTDLGALRYRNDVIIEHMHPTAGKAKTDALYQEINSHAMFNADREAFHHYIDSLEYKKLISDLKDMSR